MKRASILALALSLTGCVVGPHYRAPDALPPEQVRLQEALNNGAVTPSPLPPVRLGPPRRDTSRTRRSA